MFAGNSRLTFDRLFCEEVVRLHLNAWWETRCGPDHSRQHAAWEVRHRRSKSHYHMSVSGSNVNK